MTSSNFEKLGLIKVSDDSGKVTGSHSEGATKALSRLRHLKTRGHLDLMFRGVFFESRVED